MTGRIVPRGDPGLHHVVLQQVGDEVLAQEPDRAPVDRLGGVHVAVADVARHAAKEVSGYDPPAVVGDATHLDGGGVADRLDHLYVVEEKVHGDGSHGRPDSVACLSHPRATPAMGVCAKIT